MSSPLFGVAVVNALLFGVYGGLLHAQMESPTDSPTLIQAGTPLDPEPYLLPSVDTMYRASFLFDDFEYSI
jgi:hypothetical protein